MIGSVAKPLLLAAVAVAVVPSPEQLLDHVGLVEDSVRTYVVMGAVTLFLSELTPIFMGLRFLYRIQATWYFDPFVSALRRASR